MSAMSPADVLDAAADYIDEHGWTQGRYRTPSGECCALGGLKRVLQIDYLRVEQGKAARALAKAINAHGSAYDPGGQISEWNDRFDQTAANVTATMRKVAADLRAETP